MKRKKQTTPSPSPDLKSLIHDHNLFFDNLVSLIPAKFYLPNDDADSKPYFNGLSKIAKASFKRQTRENIKLARRNRHDPDKIAQSSTLDLLQQSITQKNNTEIVDDDDNGFEAHDDQGSVKSVTYEELRQRLRNKIQLLRGNRGGEKSLKKDKESQISDNNNNNNINNNNNNKGGEEKKRKRENEDGEEIKFGKVKIGDEEKGGNNKKKKRKMPKAKELERVTRLEEMKRENPVVAKNESWKAATSRALGVKVHDDPRLLKESIKKEKRKTVKSAEEWKERVERTSKMRRDKQQKRTRNIAERANDKKARKIAKREKKLMRPGFEGRKEGYITKD